MTDPRRLLEDVGGVQRELLRAGMEDAPPSNAKGRAAVALGVVAGTTVTTSAATAGATAVATKATWLGMSLGTVKVIGVCVASSAIAAVAIHSAVHRDSPKAVPVAAAGPAVSSVTPALPRMPVAPTIPPTPASAPAPTETATSAPTQPTQPTSIPGAHPELVAVSGSAAPIQASTMKDQLALLDLARGAYQSGDPGRALLYLKEYDELYPRSSFALESEVLRIDALSAAGRTSEALAAADRFLEAHPNELMSRHVRSIAERLRGGSNP